MKYIKKAIEIIVIFILIYIVAQIIQNNSIIYIFNIVVNKKVTLFAILAVFLIVHLIRMFRMYILLIEEKMPLKEFVPLYLKTTLANNIIPFKLGEFYKMTVYGEKLKSLSAGLSLVWIDRFFDSLILLLLVIAAIGINLYSPIFLILFVFIVFSVFLYTSFESTYKYFNRLVLEKGVSKRSKVYLEWIEEFKKIFTEAKKMLSYRGTTLVFLSTIIWGFEYLLAYLTFNVFFNIDFNLNIFINYINNTFALSNIENIIISHFNLIIMIFVFAIIYIALNIVKRKK